MWSVPKASRFDSIARAPADRVAPPQGSIAAGVSRGGRLSGSACSDPLPDPTDLILEPLRRPDWHPRAGSYVVGVTSGRVGVAPVGSRGHPSQG
jgi:hypothetical protein